MTTTSSSSACYCSVGAYSPCRVLHSTSRDHAFASACPAKQWPRRKACQGSSTGRRNSAQPPAKRTRDRLLLTKGTNRFPCDEENSSQSHQCDGGSRAPVGQDCAPCLEVQLQRLARRTGTQGRCAQYRRSDVA